MTAYRVVANVGGVLLSLRSAYSARQPWAKARMRKATKCKVTGAVIQKGEEAWRPIDNANNRADRISDAGMRRLIKESQR